MRRADDIDAELHRARLDSSGNQVTYQAALHSLPNGCFVQMETAAWLVWDDALLRWTPERYTTKIRRPARLTVAVLTPRPIVQCFEQGYQPDVHDSVRTEADTIRT